MRDVLLPCSHCRGLIEATAAFRLREAPLDPLMFLHWECFDGWARRWLAPPPPAIGALSPGTPRFVIRDSRFGG